MLQRLKESLRSSPVVCFGGYDYFIHPITDGIPRMDPELLNEIVDRVCEIADLKCDLIVGAEAMAIPLLTALTLRTGVPYNVVRKRRYGLPDEVSVRQVTGYSDKDLYINGVAQGEKVVIVDDVISTGGTLRALARALRSVGAEISDVVIIVEKIADKAAVERELDLRIKTLVKVRVEGGRVIVLS